MQNAPPEPPDQRPTVLIVDDDTQMLELLETLLTRAGYRVVRAESAVRALEALQAAAPGAVVLDIMMPERSGIEVLEHMRWNPKFAEIPVVVLSAAHVSKEELEFIQNFSLGFVDKSRIPDLLDYLKAIFRSPGGPVPQSV